VILDECLPKTFESANKQSFSKVFGKHSSFADDTENNHHWYCSYSHVIIN